jgi:hypothetical protein
MIDPDSIAAIDATPLDPGRQDKNVLPVGDNAGVIVIGAPAFRAFGEAV